MTSAIEQVLEIAKSDPGIGPAPQEILDEIGFMLDELERLEIYMDSSQCSADDYDLCVLERDSLADRLDVLVEMV